MGRADVRIAAGRIAAIGVLEPQGNELLIDARGGALLPGLHDHHIHLPALAARNASVFCGPPDISDEASLAAILSTPGTGWLRGIGYHESVAGLLDRAQLDRLVPHRPVRIQHRSGRMWFLNGLALDVLLAHAAPPPGLEREDGRFTGRLFDDDAWLQTTLASRPPGFAETSAALAVMGVTGVTEMSPANDPEMAAHFHGQLVAGHLRQSCHLAGSLSLRPTDARGALSLGPAKLHLHEALLPDWDEAVAFVTQAHAQHRCVAVHCTTETELVFALAAIEAAGPLRGDRIEHAGIAPDHLVEEIARLGLWVVSQPHFIAERGDQYAEDVDECDLPGLYRLRAFVDAGVPLAGGSDAPFGAADPWAAMAAAVSRTTRGGLTLGAGEALSAEQALALFLADPVDLTRQRLIDVGTVADLCLLDWPWEQARLRLAADDVRLTIAGGVIIHNRIDQAPV